MAKKNETVPTYLNWMQGGPLDGMILENVELMRPRVGSINEQRELIWQHAHEYRWTPDTVTGSESGRVARVWTWSAQRAEVAA